jgi:DNA-binding SARP family transcriptional activator
VDEFRLLGPLEIVVDGRPVRLDAGKPRALLALLLLNRNRAVATDVLVEELWGEAAPARATKTVQVYISQLRKALGPDRVVTKPPGYELRVEEGELDLDRFERLATEARERLAGGDAKGAAQLLEQALALWRGPALREFRTEPFADAAASRLEELRLAAQEDLLQAEIDAGRHADALPGLETLVKAEPLRERPRELLMVALYRAGRQADALDLYRRTRELYVEELGIEPGPALQELERAVLRQDPSLRAPLRAAPSSVAAAPAAPRRRWPLALAAALAAIAVAVGAVVLSRGGGGDGTTTSTSTQAPLRAFVFKLENFLGESREGRQGAQQTIGAALGCALAPGRAAARLDRVQRNRQSLLQQIAALSVPDDERALRASDLLQKAVAASIRADGIYQDWLRTQKRCPRRSLPPAGAAAADARATKLKRSFLAVFNPLARRFHQPVWRDTEF